MAIFCRFLSCWHKTEVPDDASHKNCPLTAPPLQASCEWLQMCVKPRKCIFLIKCRRRFRVVHMRPANKMLLSRHQIMHDSRRLIHCAPSPQFAGTFARSFFGARGAATLTCIYFRTNPAGKREAHILAGESARSTHRLLSHSDGCRPSQRKRIAYIYIANTTRNCIRQRIGQGAAY